MVFNWQSNFKVLTFIFYLLSCFAWHVNNAYGETISGVSPNTQKIIISHAIAMHDQPKYPATFRNFDYTSPNALKGGSIRLYAIGSYDSLNPFITKGNVADKIGLIYDSLTVPSQDEPFTQYGLVAEKIEYPEDRSWVIYHINPNARFNDGAKITANDIVFSFNLLMKKGSPIYSYYYADIKEAKLLTPTSVKFTFKNTNNKELALIIGQLPVLPEHFWKNKSFDKSSLDIPLGSGPYKVKKVDAGRSIVYERVKDYWAKDLPVNVGSYNFDLITVDYYRDDLVAIEALKAKQIDFRNERISKVWNTSYDIPAAKEGLLRKQTIRDYSPRGMQAFILNLRKPPFDNIKFRQALNYAFDFEWSNKTFFFDSYSRTNSYFSNSDLAAEGLPQGHELEILKPYRNQLPESVFTSEYKNPSTDGTGNNRANLRAAQQLLAESGYKVIDGKLIDLATNRQVVIEFLERDPTFERILNPYAENLKRLGIQLNIRSVDMSQFINRMKSHDFDMTSLTISQSQSPGNEQRDFWSSSAADTEGSSNYAGIKNPVVDALVDLVINAPSRAELVARTKALDRVLLHNYYSIPQWSILSHRLVYWDKFEQPDIAPKFDLTFDSGLLTWWVNPEKVKKIDSARN
jgi:microcin C transport system substrate-binding protein